MHALIFDCDGVLIDAECEGHRLSFNLMWQYLGIPWQWDVHEYEAKLNISGGRERLLSLFSEKEFVDTVGVHCDLSKPEQVVSEWHALKTDIYCSLVRDGQIGPRPGVVRLASEALGEGWPVCVASSGAERSVRAVINEIFPYDLATKIVQIDGSRVVRKKPCPDVYLEASATVNVRPRDCLVIEDSPNGLSAAVSAGMKCIVTTTRLTFNEEFPDAVLVVDTLGDENVPIKKFDSRRSEITPKKSVDLDLCYRLLHNPDVTKNEES